LEFKKTLGSALSDYGAGGINDASKRCYSDIIDIINYEKQEPLILYSPRESQKSKDHPGVEETD
jgi:hypothetical protein